MISKLLGWCGTKHRQTVGENIPITNRDERVDRFCRQDIIDTAKKALEQDQYKIAEEILQEVNEELQKTSSAGVPSVDTGRTTIYTEPCRIELSDKIQCSNL